MTEVRRRERHGRLVIIGSICNCLLPIACSLCLQQASQLLRFLTGGLTQTIIPEESGSLKVLPELGCCSFPPPLVTGLGCTKRCPRPLLHSMHTPPCPCPAAAIQLPPAVRTSYPSQKPFLYCFSGMRSQKWPGDSIDFQLNGIIVVSHGRSIPPFGTKISR